MKNKDDSIYISKVLKGDTSAFEFLVESYGKMAYTLAYRLLRNNEDAEEAAMDAFLKAYKSLGDFNLKAAFSTWFYKIVYNTCISRLRKKKPETVHYEHHDFDHIEDNNRYDAITKLTEEERSLYLDKAINSLNPEDAMIITLYYINECSVEEIYDISGISKANIKVRLFRARKKLLYELQKQLKKEINSIL